MGANEGINYVVFEAFANFQIVAKNPKINNFFFDDKSSKIFRVSANLCCENLIKLESYLKFNSFKTFNLSSIILKHGALYPYIGLLIIFSAALI